MKYDLLVMDWLGVDITDLENVVGVIGLHLRRWKPKGAAVGFYASVSSPT